MQTLLSLLIPLMLLAGGWCWWLAIGRLRAGQPLLPWDPRRPVPWDALDLLLTLLIAAGTQTAAGLLARQFVEVPEGASLKDLDVDSRAVLVLAGSAASVLAMVLSIGAIVLRTGATRRDFGVELHKLADDLRLGLIAFVMLAPIVYLIQLILVQWFESKHPLVELLRENPSPWFLAISGFAAVVAAPLVEEYLFRLLLQGWLEKIAWFRGRGGWISSSDDYQRPWPEPAEVSLDERDAEEAPAERNSEQAAAVSPHGPRDGEPGNPYLSPEQGVAEDSAVGEAYPARPSATGRLWPILISSSIFALLHWQHGPDWVPLLFLAAGLGYIYSRTHRLVPCITVHFLLNSLSMLALLSEIFRQAGD